MHRAIDTGTSVCNAVSVLWMLVQLRGMHVKKLRLLINRS